MVDIAPFRALRYAEPKQGSVADVLAPPYDVISPVMLDALYAKHPHNVTRIDLTKVEPGEAEDAKYTRANQTLVDWIAAGVLARESEPALYVLAQTFTGPDGVRRTRTGFFGRARLSAWDDGPILPHERTLRGPKVDRLKLMRATKYNLSPIFGTYRDPGQRVLAALEAAKQAAPIVEAQMDHVENVLWRITEPKRQGEIAAALRSSALYIADGHHRYETGLAYRDERRAAAGGAPADVALRPIEELPGYESILMFSSAVEDPGMVIFPTHRLVHGLPSFDDEKMLFALEVFFDREHAPADAHAAQKALAEAGKKGNAYLYASKNGRWILTAKETAPWDTVAALPKHPALRKLDVGVLHGVVLEHLCGISVEAQAAQTNLRYSKDFNEAFTAATREADVQAAFLMNPTKIEEVIEVAEAGEVMPQKSTFFYPKIPTGLVLCPLE